MKKNHFSFLVLMFAFLPLLVSAQNWTPEEKEVLEVDSKMEKAWVERDLDGYMDCLHKDFVGWFQKDPIPIDKKSLRSWEKHWLSTSKIIHSEIKPVSVVISGDVAILYLYHWVLREDEKGKELGYNKWTEIFKKENGKWLILGMSGGKIQE